MHPTQAIKIFGNVAMPLGTLVIPDLSIKKLQISSQGTPALGLNAGGVAKKIAILDLSEAISRKRCKIGSKLLSLGH